MSETTERATGATDGRELLARALAGHMCADPENIRMETSLMIEEVIDAQLAALETAGYRIVPADDVLSEAEREALTLGEQDMLRAQFTDYLTDRVMTHSERVDECIDGVDRVLALRRRVARGGGES